MKTKNFDVYLKKRLDKKEIADIKSIARSEFEALKRLQSDIAKWISKYMAQEDIGFNELVRRLGVSASQAVKIRDGQANLTLASIAHIAALIKKRPHLIFE